MHAHVGQPLVEGKAGSWRVWKEELPWLWEKELPWLGCAVFSPTAARGAALWVVGVFKPIFINMIKYLLHESAIRAALKR